MRTLTFRQAARCEAGEGQTCACRCRGALHGAQRTLDPRTLPLGDPHTLRVPCPLCTRQAVLPGTVCPVCRDAPGVLAREVPRTLIRHYLAH